MFGLYLLSEDKPSTAADGRLARLLLDFFDPITAAVIGNYATVIFGALLVILGLYVRFNKKA